MLQRKQAGDRLPASIEDDRVSHRRYPRAILHWPRRKEPRSNSRHGWNGIPPKSPSRDSIEVRAGVGVVSGHLCIGLLHFKLSLQSWGWLSSFQASADRGYNRKAISLLSTYDSWQWDDSVSMLGVAVLRNGLYQTSHLLSVRKRPDFPS